MIRITIQITADTDEHILEICEDMCRHVTKGSPSVDSRYAWPDSSLNLVREKVSDESSTREIRDT